MLPRSRKQDTAESLEDAIARLIDEAPPLSDEQRARLAILLRPSAPAVAA